jgi:hypothetical protein
MPIQIGTEEQYCGFLENGSNNFDLVSVIYEGHVPE